MEKEILEKQLEAFNKLYISVRDVYIQQKSDGSYSHSRAFKNSTKLTDEITIQHLKKQKTIGIMCPEKSSKFITFDVDAEGYNEQERRAIVRGIIREIVRFGIPRHFIYLVYSGSKGYHINIFFNEMVYLNLLHKFYEHILYTAGYNNLLVEFRPTPSIGIKLPLSIHRKNNSESYFVDDNFNKINDRLYITKILRYDRDIFQEMTIDLEHEDELINKIRVLGNELCPNKFQLLSKQDIEILEMDGITKPSTRNYISVQLAVFYNSNGLTRIDALDRLNKWIKNQNKKMFTTPIERCYIENEKIIDWVYDNDIKHSVKQNMIIKIPEKEFKIIDGIIDKNCRRLLFSLLCHSKRYISLDGNFYMTHSQMEFYSKVNRNNIKKSLDWLIDNEYLIGVRIGQYKQTNIYKINFKYEGSRYKVSIKYKDYDKPYIDCIEGLV